jgi:toxin-antitoxin system PIN domain toxin
MQMHVVDTNVLVHAVSTGSPWHVPCRAALERWRAQRSPWYVTWSVVYEFVRLATHVRTFERPWSTTQAWGFIRALLATPGLGVLAHTSRHADVAEQVFRELPQLRGNIVHDLHIAILMREHGLRRVVTRDADFHRFPFLDVVDPVAAAGGPGGAERPRRYAAARRQPRRRA